MYASLVPTATDLAALLGYVLGNPFLFISSSTVMTTGLILGAVAMSLVPRGGPALRIAAPTLAMVLAYFGLGSMVLATEILVRFHAAIPDATETQFASGIAHLVEAAAGIVILFTHLRRRTRRSACRNRSGPGTRGAHLPNRHAPARPGASASASSCRLSLHARTPIQGARSQRRRRV